MHNKQITPSIVLVLMLAVSSLASAKTKIAVLDFELNDITSLPNTTKEKLRTAGIKTLLEQALAKSADVELVPVSAQAYAKANAGFGYLFRFHDLAARLGQQFGADWVIVGQHSKPSYLFSYLLVRLVNTSKPSQVTDYAIELKGNHEKVMRRGVNALTGKILEDLP